MDHNLRELRVLLVEDSSWTRESIAEVIKQSYSALRLSIVDCEADAIESASKNSPHLVILDLLLRRGNGFGVLKYLGKRPSRPKIVVLTNFALPKYREFSLLMGADYFLDKALSMQQLPEIVNSVVQDVQFDRRSG